ncbi:hypothetical protein HK407_03g05450 [Ordospora pajunii]|jgi:RNase P subunit RPR2|uniref:uncharacterized protein n=1 Tax=Ordospora pajunii TaxID=3039483 RepID=UPI0029527536|nr:uncharacterized protein HK407_03g05450 [Ordospora pajunii]KAH9411795.1 hypothetical protein HK407_03g05450 [Ordospora pajunii]
MIICRSLANIHEDLKYLMCILPAYMGIGGEKYVLSRIRHRMHRDGDGLLKMVFCGKCLHVYVPVVNSRVWSENDKLFVECTGCNVKTESKIEQDACTVRAYGNDSAETEVFEYFFV